VSSLPLPKLKGKVQNGNFLSGTEAPISVNIAVTRKTQ
jgi:hypothetical protein